MCIRDSPKEAYDRINYDVCKGILDVEMSIPALFAEDVAAAVKDRAAVSTYLRSGGNMLSKAEIIEAALKIVNGKEA